MRTRRACELTLRRSSRRRALEGSKGGRLATKGALSAALSRGTGLIRTVLLLFALRHLPAAADGFTAANNLPNAIVDMFGGGTLLGILYRRAHVDRDGRIRSDAFALVLLGCFTATIITVFASSVATQLGLAARPHVVVLIRICAWQIPAYVLFLAINAADQRRRNFWGYQLGNSLANVLACGAILLYLKGAFMLDDVALAFTFSLLATSFLMLLSRPRRGYWRRTWALSLLRDRTARSALPRELTSAFLLSGGLELCYFISVHSARGVGSVAAFQFGLSLFSTVVAIMLTPILDVLATNNLIPDRNAVPVVSILVVAVALTAGTSFALSLHLPSRSMTRSVLSQFNLLLLVVPAQATLYLLQRNHLTRKLYRSLLVSASMVATSVLAAMYSPLTTSSLWTVSLYAGAASGLIIYLTMPSLSSHGHG